MVRSIAVALGDLLEGRVHELLERAALGGAALGLLGDAGVGLAALLELDQLALKRLDALAVGLALVVLTLVERLEARGRPRP